jgi:hypothetical protein
MENLKPCPFCCGIPFISKKQKFLHRSTVREIYFCIECNNCHAKGTQYAISCPKPYTYSSYEIEPIKNTAIKKSIEAWNRRVVDGQKESD